MSKAVICPVCSGAGKIDEDYPGAGKSNVRTCHGCGGKGWVEVAEDPMPYTPYPYYIPPVYPNYKPYYPNTAPWYPNTTRWYCND